MISTAFLTARIGCLRLGFAELIDDAMKTLMLDGAEGPESCFCPHNIGHFHRGMDNQTDSSS